MRWSVDGRAHWTGTVPDGMPGAGGEEADPLRVLRATLAALRTDPVYGAFVQALPFAHSTLFIDEAGQRQAWLDGINMVLKQGASPADAMKKIAADEQKILNSYYK